MEVIVTLPERRSGRGHGRLKKGVRRDRSGLPVDVVEECAEEADLPVSAGSTSEEGGLTYMPYEWDVLQVR